MTNPSSINEAVLSGHTADIYFSRTQAILRAEGLDPVVTMEIFPAADGILCGVNEVFDLLAQVLPDDSEVWALSEGQAMVAKEVVLRITAPYSAFGLYETAILGMLSQTSGWATEARACVEAAEGIPIVSFGARHVHPHVVARLEYAAIVGGCAGCATPAGAELAGLEAIGTIPHAMILIFGDTVEATLAFDRHMPTEVKRVALVDTFKDEAEESLRVAEALGRRLWGVRLDTPPERGRVTPDMVKEVRARLDQAGYTWVKIVVSGGVDAERIRLFREQGAPVDLFGIGSAISSAPPTDFTGDLKVVAGQPIAKRGRIPGITANPRLKRVALAKVKEGTH
ncbi:MAG: nicotinate phosphoribosyltransferase [Anaerolineae bacterium SM23_84]|jgi:nicotinate phosphoribosyltransferase|nr:MAG: nicotinate phosphoribosyltransferase [Anaerolineae bacterium SM23_84]